MEEITFAGLRIEYDHRVLKPRDWTEAQSAWAAELADQTPPGPVLELCAGVGHIGLATVRDSDRDVVMVDINPVAQDFAQHNAAINKMEHRVEFRLAPMENALGNDERFALIIADPPWVASAQTTRFPEDPVQAIDGGADGLDLARTCIELITAHLADDGAAVLQLGTTQQVELLAGYAAQFGDRAVSVQDTKVFDDGVLVHLAR